MLVPRENISAVRKAFAVRLKHIARPASSYVFIALAQRIQAVFSSRRDNRVADFDKATRARLRNGAAPFLFQEVDT
jgi:hypothetical protein